MRVEQFDPGDDARLMQWVEAANTSTGFDRPTAPMVSLAEMQGVARGFGAVNSIFSLATSTDGGVIGCSVLSMPELDNIWTAELTMHVVPGYRGLGVGRAIIEQAEATAVAHGRRVLSVWSESEIGLEQRAAGFAKTMGYVPVLAAYQQALRLPATAAKLDHLIELNAPWATDFRVVTWTAHCPDELLDGLVELQQMMSADSPRTEIGGERQVWDRARVRAFEDEMIGMGNLVFYAGAIDERSDRLAALTVVAVKALAPADARQYATIVDHDHRGNRLGVLIKIANVRQVMEKSPGTTRILTWNAEKNAHVNRINEALGYAVSGQLTAWQRQLPKQ